MRIIIALFICTYCLHAQEISFLNKHLNEHDRIVLTHFVTHAAEFAQKVDVEAIRKKCHESPEMFAWIDFRQLNCLPLAYQLTGDTVYLDHFLNAFATYQSIMSKEHDDYLGWYGLALKNRRPTDNPDILIDELQMNFRAISIICNWLEQARSNTAYAEHHKTNIDELVALMEDHLFPKWDKRGHFKDLGKHGGVYCGLDYPIKKLNSLSFEKLSMMFDGSLRLYCITKKPRYMKRALQIGTWYKKHLRLIDGHYEWNSWVPGGKWDIHPSKDDAWISWVAPDPNGGWYVAGLSIGLSLYQHGLLFTDKDIGRFIKTQKEQCWNGDFEKPIYATCAGVTPAQSKWVKGRFLSDALARYDDDLYKLAFAGPHEKARFDKASSSWHGGINAQAYVLQKYLMTSSKEKPQPFKAIGEAFLSNAENKTYYNNLNFAISGTGASATVAPSKHFAE